MGSRSTAATVVRRLALRRGAELSPVGACVPDPGAPLMVNERELPVLGGLDDVLDAVAASGADAVVITGSLPSGRVQRLTWALEGTGIDMFVVPALTHQAVELDVRPVAGLPLVYVNQGHVPPLVAAGGDRGGRRRRPVGRTRRRGREPGHERHGPCRALAPSPNGAHPMGNGTPTTGATASGVTNGAAATSGAAPTNGAAATNGAAPAIGASANSAAQTSGVTNGAAATNGTAANGAAPTNGAAANGVTANGRAPTGGRRRATRPGALPAPRPAADPAALAASGQRPKPRRS